MTPFRQGSTKLAIKEGRVININSVGNYHRNVKCKTKEDSS